MADFTNVSFVQLIKCPKLYEVSLCSRGPWKWCQEGHLSQTFSQGLVDSNKNLKSLCSAQAHATNIFKVLYIKVFSSLIHLTHIY